MRAPYVTVAEAAKKLGISESTLRRSLDRNGPTMNGIAIAVKYGRIWYCMPWNIDRVLNGESDARQTA